MNYSLNTSSNLVHLAYRLLKQDTYYEKMDLFLRANVPAYEVSNSFQKRQVDFAYILDIFPVLKEKEKKVFGKFTSKRKCLVECGRIEGIFAVAGVYS